MSDKQWKRQRRKFPSRRREEASVGRFDALGQSLWITAVYILAGSLWIVLTDNIAEGLFTSPAALVIFSTVKGLFYVLLTAALIFLLVYPALKKLVASIERSRKSEETLLYAQQLARMGSFEYDLVAKRFTFTQIGLELFGLNPETFSGTLEETLVHFPPEERAKALAHERQAIEEKKVVRYDCRILIPGSGERYLSVRIEPVFDEDGNCIKILGINHDITERKRIEDALSESERSKAVLLSHLPGVAFRCRYDPLWTMEFLSEGCYELTGYRPEALINSANISFNDLICPEYRESVWEEYSRRVKEKTSFKYEYEIMCASGERKWVLELSQGIYNEAGEVEALEGLLIDITESKQRFLRIAYMNDHDLMTGLYNRRYYEDAKKELDIPENLPLSIILADINGVRLINDAFGHDEGDGLIASTAKVIRECCRERDVLARIGGDEFAILLPNTDEEEARRIIAAIYAGCESYNATAKDKARQINLSVGSGIKKKPDYDLAEAERDAESFVGMQKLLDQKSHHSAVLSNIMATMYERSFETEEHAQRIARICGVMGEKMNLSEKEQNELHLFAMLHDIGKIGIDDKILKKPGKLTTKEWPQMKKHCDIGYRIAMSSGEFSPVAKYILTHHERWDGTGYPGGLKGEEIPLLSRILAIADVYDAMTEDRVYRKAMTHEDALEEIEKNAGTQFDPAIARLFLENADRWE